MMVDRDTLNNCRASRKKDREYIARAVLAIVERHGSQVEQIDDRGEITLRLSLEGVGALIHIDAVHGGAWSLIHWHNAGFPCRNFSKRFNAIVGGLLKSRPHHKATSSPNDWYSLAMLLDGGLCLAARNEAFEPFDL